jgi:hypothetical protein
MQNERPEREHANDSGSGNELTAKLAQFLHQCTTGRSLISITKSLRSSTRRGSLMSTSKHQRLH